MRPVRVTNQVTRNLCDNCACLDRIVLHECGEAFRRCQNFPQINLSKFASQVSDCTGYVKNEHQPIVFAEEAWILDIDQGKVHFTESPRRQQEQYFREMSAIRKKEKTKAAAGLVQEDAPDPELEKEMEGIE